MSDDLQAGIFETLLTDALAQRLSALDLERLSPATRALLDAEAADRLSRHLARIVARAIDATPEEHRAEHGLRLVRLLLDSDALADILDPAADVPVEPNEILAAILRRLPDGSVEQLEAPLTPLLDTTLLTNSPGEPAVGHELRAEIHSADAIDVVMACVRWSGIKPLLDALGRHCDHGKPLRLVTTTYTNSTELKALEALRDLGAEIKVSYATDTTRLHAKAWVFHRSSGYSTAYIGSSNLTHSAMQSGIEWNVRVSGVRNPDVVAKMEAVFNAYWESGDFRTFDATEFQERTEAERAAELILSPFEMQLRPFQERLLEQIELSRRLGHHRNLLVAATGTGKTVMAAFDYARLRRTLPRDRLLFVAHRKEILDQSRVAFAHLLRDGSFGEMWVAGQRPSRFEHVFASIQTLDRASLDAIDPDHFDVVIVDEFHHAAAKSYQALLERLKPQELLGLTATPERADGLDVLHHFDGRQRGRCGVAQVARPAGATGCARR